METAEDEIGIYWKFECTLTIVNPISKGPLFYIFTNSTKINSFSICHFVLDQAFSSLFKVLFLLC